MKYKNIIFYFAITLPACVMLRVLQVLFTIDGATGFTKQQYAGIGMYISIVIYIAVFATAAIGFTVRRCPIKLPKTPLPLGICSIALGLGMIYDMINVVYAARIPMWQISLLDAFGFISALFFIAYGAGAFIRVNIPRLLYVLPVIYWLIRIIYAFTAISALTLITDNVLMLLHYCAVLLFMLEFAKLANGIAPQKSNRKIMAVGLSAVLLCAVSAIPRIVASMLGRDEVVHESISSVISAILNGAFIAVFLFSHFKNGHKYMPDPKPLASKIMGED